MKKIEEYIVKKREELVHSLFKEGYTYTQIAKIFNLNRSTIMRIINKK